MGYKKVTVYSDAEITASYYPGYAPRPYAYGGEGDPGDPAELTDICVTIFGIEVEFDTLPQKLKDRIESALIEEG